MSDINAPHQYSCIAWRDTNGGLTMIHLSNVRQMRVSERGIVTINLFDGSKLHLEKEQAACVIPQLSVLHPPIPTTRELKKLAKELAAASPGGD